MEGRDDAPLSDKEDAMSTMKAAVVRSFTDELVIADLEKAYAGK